MVTMWLGIARPVILTNLIMPKSPSSLVTSSAVVVELIRSTFQTSTLAAADLDEQPKPLIDGEASDRAVLVQGQTGNEIHD